LPTFFCLGKELKGRRIFTVPVTPGSELRVTERIDPWASLRPSLSESTAWLLLELELEFEFELELVVELEPAPKSESER
jgi:hypothetical protein